MLDAVVDYLPSRSIFRCRGTSIDDKSVKLTRKASDDEPFAALVFKIMTARTRVSGVLPRLFGEDERRRIDLQRSQGPQERVGRLLRMHATSAKIFRKSAGDIAQLLV